MRWSTEPPAFDVAASSAEARRTTIQISSSAGTSERLLPGRRTLLLSAAADVSSGSTSAVPLPSRERPLSALRGPSPGEYGSNSPPITPHLRRRLPNHRPLLCVPTALRVASARHTLPFSADRQSAGRYTSICSRSGGPVISLLLTPKSPIRETPFYG
jgi:hypothetical protein